MISFVLATRNDGYGGGCPGVPDFTMRRLQITVQSLLALGIAGEIIVVEWCPPADRPRVGEFLPDGPIRILTVSPELGAELDAANPAPRKLPFYEYVAKDIGIRRAACGTIAAVNPDNIFPLAGLHRAVDGLDDMTIARAIRHEIARDYAREPLSELIAQADARTLRVFKSFRGAGGDFCAFTRGGYDRLGGYLLVHGNRGVDAEFDARARANGVRIVQEYEHYHVTHDGAIVEAPGRPLSVAECPRIPAELAARLLDYVSED